MPLWAESRIHGDVYVRFGGRLSETYHRKVAWRRQPSLQNHRPEDKPRHGNLVAQVRGDGEEHLPSHLVTLKQHTDERRKEHHHDR